MGKTARITIEVECRMPESKSFIPSRGYTPEKYREMIGVDLLPCKGSGNMNEYCATRRCRWAKYDDWDVKPL